MRWHVTKNITGKQAWIQEIALKLQEKMYNTFTVNFYIVTDSAFQVIACREELF